MVPLKAIKNIVGCAVTLPRDLIVLSMVLLIFEVNDSILNYQ
jgi:hypothetical protein